MKRKQISKQNNPKHKNKQNNNSIKTTNAGTNFLIN